MSKFYDEASVVSRTIEFDSWDQFQARIRVHYAARTTILNYFEFERIAEFDLMHNWDVWGDQPYNRKPVTFMSKACTSTEVSTDGGKTWKAVMWNKYFYQLEATSIELNAYSLKLTIHCKTILGPVSYTYDVITGKLVVKDSGVEVDDVNSFKSYTLKDFIRQL